MAQQELFIKVRRLRKQKDFLKERGMSMQSHNQKVLEILDSENPPSEAEVAAADAEIMREQLESHVLAATSDSLGVDTSLGLPVPPSGSR